MANELSDQEALIVKTLIDFGPSHGFDVREAIHGQAGHRISTASVYRILHRLEEAGVLEAYWEEDAASHQGPRRRYYKARPIAATVLLRYAEELSRRAAVFRRPGFESIG